MFRSTHGFVDVFSYDSEPMAPQWFQMALDETTGTRLFEVDEISLKDSPNETVLLLDIGTLRLPFLATCKNEGGWDWPLSCLQDTTWLAQHAPAGASVIEVDVNVGCIGERLDGILWYPRFSEVDPWHGVPERDARFASDDERRAVARAIQEALPVLLFEHDKRAPSPRVRVRHVTNNHHPTWQPLFDPSGALERRSLQ